MTELKTSLTEFLAERLDSAIDWLKQMVEINSFTENKAGVDRLGRFTAKCFEGLGFSAEYVPAANSRYGDHLVLQRAGRKRDGISMITHLDTVFSPEDEARDRFHWRPEGNRIYGPGTMDIKGGTVMIHLVLAALKRFHPDLFEGVTWRVLANSCEEVLSNDFSRLCLSRMGKGREAALVFEAGNQTNGTHSVVIARKGRATFRVKVEGRGAHAGSQHRRGANAVVQLAEIVRSIAAMTDYSNELTFNVGSISGGTVVNRVPHEAVAEVEMRAFTSEAYRTGLDSVRQLSTVSTVRSAEDGFPCRVQIQIDEETPPWPRNPKTDRLFDIWREAGESAGINVEPEHRGGISDGNFLWHAVSTIDGLGPAGDNAHCSESSADGLKQPEYVDIRSFVPKAALNVIAIVRWLSSPM